MIEIKTDDMGVKRGYKPRKPGGGRKKRKPLITAGVYEDTAFLSTVVSYLGIVALVFDCPGVVDVENARINGQEKSLILTARQFPVALPVRISVKEVADA